MKINEILTAMENEQSPAKLLRLSKQFKKAVLKRERAAQTQEV